MRESVQLELDFIMDIPESDSVDLTERHTAFLIFIGAEFRYFVERRGESI